MATDEHLGFIPNNLAFEHHPAGEAPANGVRKPPKPERLLNAREVAAELGVSERWVRDHTSRRNPMIRAVKLGSLVRYRRADVDAFMESMTTDFSSTQQRFSA